MEPMQENSSCNSNSSFLETRELLHCNLPELEIKKIQLFGIEILIKRMRISLKNHTVQNAVFLGS